MNKILMVGGRWDLEGGRPSSLANKFASNLENVTLFNGGHYEQLKNIINLSKDYESVIWWVDVPNELPKLNSVKEVNFKTMLITGKRNDNDKYSFQELLQRALHSKSNLVVEFKKEADKLFGMRLFDPLGNLWYQGTDIKECAKALEARLESIKTITRESTTTDEENKGALAWFFNMFKQEMYKSEEQAFIPSKKYFLQIVQEYAYKAARVMSNGEDIKRFLGNASFRCPKGFPSFRDGKYIFVSKRNVNKEYITIDDFVPVYLKDNKVYYCGEAKPSVDTPIQVRLYNLLPNINYMIHSHCYIPNAPFTEEALPCGALEELDEIKKVVDFYHNGDYNREFYCINLLGHGSIMMSKYPCMLRYIELEPRPLPEEQTRLVLKK